MKPIRLSVRGVTELVLRCGDIDSRYVDSSAMMNGAAAHRKIQKAMGDNYRREVSLKLETEAAGIPVTLHGRADGIMLEGERLTVDEIKTTTLPLDRLALQRELHSGQAKCYAYMLLRTSDQPVSSVTIQLTYYQLETEELQRTSQDFSPAEIADFFDDLMRRYGVWLRFERDWKELRDASIKSAGFPFESYRPGQRGLAVSAYRAIEHGRKLYTQAPTGIGKTVSALFPAIKAIGEGLCDKLFYLTAKTVTRAVAEDAVRRMAARGLRLKSLTLRAKEKICFTGETACNPEACEFARGHYDRVGDALLDLLKHNDIITPAIMEDICRRHRVCPHETALDTALWADLVVCDYNHVFDPEVYLRRFFGDDAKKGEYVFLIDEAHNLADRVRDMYSVTLKKSDFDRTKKAVKGREAPAKKLRQALGAVIGRLNEIRDENENPDVPHIVAKHPDERLVEAVREFIVIAGDWLAIGQNSAHPAHADLLELFFAASSFAGVDELFDERFAFIAEFFGRDVAATLFCLDPSRIIGERLGFARASVLFSATLTPLGYYRELLGGAPEDPLLALPSPFPPGNLLLAAHCGVSTKYADRPGSIAPIAEAIDFATNKKRGNYLVYFPSYEYLRPVYEAFCERRPDVNTVLQQSAMSEDERAAFLGRFDSANEETLVGFCVLGGVFSEGIDLVGERLIGTVIVGVGLPKINLRQDLIRDYFDGINGAGFDYAYVYPGMNKVLQAAGRVIRTENDRGLVLLIDSRFGTQRYRGLFPPHWSGMKFIRSLEDWPDQIAVPDKT